MGNSFLDKTLGEMSLADLQNIIRNQINLIVPPIPAGVANLTDPTQVPVVSPPAPGNNEVLVYNAATNAYVPVAQSAMTHTDGYAPGSSPTPVLIGGTNLLVATWAPVTLNSAGGTQVDTVYYEVHISVTSGFTPSSSTIYAQIAGTGIFIKNMPDGSKLTYDTPYYVRLIAKDADGAAAAGTQSSSVDMVQINGASDIQVNTITDTLLQSQLVLSTTILAGTPGAARIELSSSGLLVYDASNNLQTILPSNGSTSIFRGNVETGSLQVDGGMTVSGATNVMDKGSQLTLLDRVADPSGAPTLNWNIQKTALSGGANLPDPYPIFEINGTSGYWQIVNEAAGAGVYLYMYDTTATFVAKLLLNANSGTSWQQIFDITLLGGVLYILYEDGSGNFKLGKVTNPTNSSTWAFSSIGSISTSITTSTGMGLTNDGTNLIVMNYHGLTTGAVIRATAYSTAAAFVSTTDLTGGSATQTSSGARNIGGACYDGTNWYVNIYDFTGGSGISVTHVEKYVASTHAYVSNSGASWAIKRQLGLAWNSTTTRLVMNDGSYVYTPTNWTWTHSSGDKFFVQYSWYDGTHESKSSPYQTADLSTPTNGIYPQQYGRINVTVPTFPSGVTAVRTYMLQGSGSAPAAGSATSWLQTVATYADSNSSTSYHIILYLGSGSHDLSASTFAGATSTLLATATGLSGGAPWKLGGDGEMRLPNQTTAARYGSPEAGDLAFNVTTLFPEVYDGSNWSIQGEREEMEIANALVTLGATDTYPICSPFDPVNATAQASGSGGFATGLILGIAQMVRTTRTATGILIWNGAAGTAGTFNGAALYHLNAAGDWVFDIDSGSSTQASIITGTGQIKIPFTTTFTLIPGRVYIAAVIRAFTGSPTFLGAGGAAAALGGSTGGPLRCASAAKTGRQNSTIAVANLTVRTILPYQAIY